jgi:hypothetical protein
VHGEKLRSHEGIVIKQGGMITSSTCLNGSPPMETIVGLLVMLALPGYVVLQVWTARAYWGGWRIAALAPLVVMIPLLAWTVFSFAAGSNLWPLLLILTAPFACTYLGLLMLARVLSA